MSDIFLHPRNPITRLVSLLPEGSRSQIIALLGVPMGFIVGTIARSLPDSLTLFALGTFLVLWVFVALTTIMVEKRDKAERTAKDVMECTKNLKELHKTLQEFEPNSAELIKPRPVSKEFIQALKNAGAREELIKAIEKDNREFYAKLERG